MNREESGLNPGCLVLIPTYNKILSSIIESVQNKNALKIMKYCTILEVKEHLLHILKNLSIVLEHSFLLKIQSSITKMDTNLGNENV